ncbi:GPI-anchor transamidase isoform X2 [Neoarius graeffei]|uniref:GPI-anchor transamidase isoform X2 n=1 Tax=Neoarius graeffei TaxID=443677 RepID=UPI00298CB5E2|nr:GPI-anchor transamidase isoform X2 [Neoarius graeffei]
MAGFIFITLFAFINYLPIVHSNSFETKAAQFFSSGHTNNWAVLVCTSRFWFNYRHVANVLSVYRSVKRLGIPDSHIVLMLADDMACNHRNPKPATVFSHKNMELNVYGDDVEVDYRGYEVTVENFLRVLTGRLPASTPRSKRLLSDDRSNILIYLTGHGGNGFLKFQDSEEISNVELADAFEQMWQKRRYNELLFIIDTCQGASMYERFYSPNLMALASSQIGEDSLSHQPDLAIGVHLMDRYTFYLLEFLEDIHPASQANMNDLFKVCPQSQCVSTPGHRTDLFLRHPGSVLITDFFGSVRKVEITREVLNLTAPAEEASAVTCHVNNPLHICRHGYHRTGRIGTPQSTFPPVKESVPAFMPRSTPRISFIMNKLK